MNEDHLLAYAIINSVAAKLNMPMHELIYSKIKLIHKRKIFLSQKRSICIIKILSETTLTLKEIGKIFHIDYSTVIYNRDSYNDNLYRDRNLMNLIRIAA